MILLQQQLLNKDDRPLPPSAPAARAVHFFSGGKGLSRVKAVLEIVLVLVLAVVITVVAVVVVISIVI